MAELSLPLPASSLTLRHALLALAVTFVWGTNFVIIRIGLAHLPPLLFAALRFTLVAFPAIFFLKRPQVPWRMLGAYGLFIGAGQFGILFIAMKSSISPGLASLVVQSQVFFTIGLAMMINRERLRIYHVAALVLAFAGLGVILTHANKDAATPLGLALTLVAAASWAAGNAVSKAVGKVDMLAFVVWSALFAVPPLFVFSLIFDRRQAIEAGLTHATLGTWAAVVWQSVGNSMFGYAVWGWLLARYPAATVSPLSLLVPVFGMAASAWWLAEPLPGWKLGAAALIMAGLALNIIWPRVAARLGASPA
jgi:O-acetylserine/cysteine efflux transporter